jgi:hypothetical protein
MQTLGFVRHNSEGNYSHTSVGTLIKADKPLIFAVSFQNICANLREIRAIRVVISCLVSNHQ